MKYFLLILLLLPNFSLAIDSIDDLGVVSHWTCDEASGVRYDENHSNNNDLTDNNTVSSVTGKLNNACDFELSNTEYLSIVDGSQNGLDITGDMSFSVWVKFESDNNNDFHTFYSKYNGVPNSKQYIVGYNTGSNELTFWYFNDTESQEILTYGWTPNLSQWYHVVGLYDASASKVEFYVDGTLLGSDTGTLTDINAGNAMFDLGAYDNGNYLMDGLMDEITIDNELWTSQNITDLYNSGTPLPYSFTATTTSTSTTSTSSSAFSFSTTTTEFIALGSMSLFGIFLLFIILLTAGIIIWTIRA